MGLPHPADPDPHRRPADRAVAALMSLVGLLVVILIILLIFGVVR